MNLSVDLCGNHLKNPVIPASGTFGFGRELAKYYDLSLLGAVATKGITPEPRIGNAPVRIAETPSGMLNSVGLQNPGIDAFLETELPWLAAQNVPIIANISGAVLEDYVHLAEKLKGTPVDLLEVNISCPNVKKGGAAFGTMPDMAMMVTKAVKAAADKPVMVKLTPNVRDITEIALACQEGGADAVSLINTLLGMCVDVHTRRPVLANVMGGLSGPAVLPVALRMAYQVAKAVSIPVVGMGGVYTGEDAIAFLLCGCTAVQVGTANLSDPMACPRILSEIREYMRRHSISELSSLIGALKEG